MKTITLKAFFSDLTDPRQSWKTMHQLFDILFLTISGVIAGCDGWKEIEDFGHDRLSWLREYGDFTNGVPSHDTLARTMGLLEPEEFQKRFIWWMRACEKASKGSVIAIDGKTLRGSYDKRNSKEAIHMVSAFRTENSQVLGQRKTDTKSNEITCIPELIDILDVKGSILTIDAMGCQKKIAEKIVNKEADYLLAVKGNQGKLHDGCLEHFPVETLIAQSAEQENVYLTHDKSHGRDEKRYYFVFDVPHEMVDIELEWRGLKRVGVAISLRQEPNKATDIAVRYYISSAPLTAKEFGEAVRAHWGIENSLHWCLDVGMREDECRIRQDRATENLAAVRHIAINLLKRDETLKGGIKRKRQKAARCVEYLSNLITVLVKDQDE